MTLAKRITLATGDALAPITTKSPTRAFPRGVGFLGVRCCIACAQLSLTPRARSRASGTHRYVGEECFDAAKARWGLPLAFGTPAPVRRYRCPSRSEQRFARMLPLHHSMRCVPFANS